MSSANSANEKPIAAFVGIDWADQKHDIVSHVPIVLYSK